MTFATCYSGIGGADLGFVAAGWTPIWQAEADPFRQRILLARFRVPVAVDIGVVTQDATLPAVDVLYGELPDHRLDRWWPSLHAVWRQRPPRRWLIVEFSPTVRCEQIIRDIVLAGWSFRLLHLQTELQSTDIASEEWDRRKRAVVLASSDPSLMDSIGLAGMSAELFISCGDTGHVRLSLPWHEVSRGFRAGYTCLCGHGLEACDCPSGPRLAALGDATSPYMTRWLAEVLDGVWQDGVDRKLTAADGRM